MKEIYKVDNHIFYHIKWEDRSAQQKFKHGPIFPINTYSPWDGDEEFKLAYEAIKGHTLLDVYRCFELWDLSKQFSSTEADILEIGVWRGGSALILAKNNSKGNIYLCDTFEGVVKAGEMDAVYKGGEHADTSVDIVQGLLNENGISNYIICKGIFPDETADLVSTDKIKICHIDVDVYQSAKDIFEWVYPKLISGGVVIFDDYGFAACEGITTLVNEICETYPDLLKFYNLNGHGLLIKK